MSSRLGLLELDHAVDECKQGVVLADTYVVAGVEVRSALSDENVSGVGKYSIARYGQILREKDAFLFDNKRLLL